MIKKKISRSYFKLKEIDEKLNIFYNINSVLELGCFPGGWTQYILENYKKINLISIDIKPKPKEFFKNSFYIKIDAFNKNIIRYIKLLQKKKFDLIISDICPNITGIKLVDKQKIISIISRIDYISRKLLKKKGNLIFKILSEGLEKKISCIFYYFKSIKFIRLKFKKKRSSESFVYLNEKII